jgi:predicted transcriptional regulator
MSELNARPLPQVMSHPVVALQPYDTVTEALATAREHSVHHFPVCANERLIGMVCVCDFRNAQPETRVVEVMRPAVTLPAVRSSEDAARLMKSAFVGSILVVDWQGAPCGIVTRGDLMDDGPANEILKDSKCECCRAVEHLRSYHGAILCVSCRDRATEPEAYDTGGGD